LTTPEPSDQQRARVADEVDRIFERLVSGRLGDTAPDASGWEMTLPSGLAVTRSTLQAEAQPLVRLGVDAVPALLRWAQDEQPALRYVATFALEEITEQRPFVRHFAEGSHDADRERAIRAWRAWYDAQRT
jgi:hypothetical protein